MVIFLNEDRAYLSWLRQHRSGYVLDAQGNPHRRQRILHRATCQSIRQGKHRHWTTGQRLKACSLDLAELAGWAQETGGFPADVCQTCCPQLDKEVAPGVESPASEPLTPLSSNVLNFVLESSVIQLRQSEPDYRLTVGETATSLHKTARQLAPALRRLLAADYIHLSQKPSADGSYSPRTIIWPTATGLSTLPAFAEMRPPEVQAELERLTALTAQRRNESGN